MMDSSAFWEEPDIKSDSQLTEKDVFCSLFFVAFLKCDVRDLLGAHRYVLGCPGLGGFIRTREVKG